MSKKTLISTYGETINIGDDVLVITKDGYEYTGKLRNIGNYDISIVSNDPALCIDLDNISSIYHYDFSTGKTIKPKDEDKMVTHPDHYQTKNGLEAIDVIEAFTEDLTGIEAVDTGNAIKYICRWKKKNGLQDLKKAQWYLNHLIKHMEKEEKESK